MCFCPTPLLYEQAREVIPQQNKGPSWFNRARRVVFCLLALWLIEGLIKFIGGQ